MSFEIINQNFINIGKSGYIFTPYYFDEDNIKQKISSQSFVPKAYIIKLYYRSIFGGFYEINSLNYNKISIIYAMINDTYNSLYSSISSLSSQNSL